MHVVLVGWAKAWRLRPLLFLGAEMSRRGHTVTLLCPRSFAAAMRPLCDVHGVIMWEVHDRASSSRGGEVAPEVVAPAVSRALSWEVGRWGTRGVKADRAIGAALRDLDALAPVSCCLVDVAFLEGAKAVRLMGFPCALHIPGASAHADLRWLLGLVLGGDVSRVRNMLRAPPGSRAVLSAIGGLREFFGACAGRTLLVSGCPKDLGAACFPNAGSSLSIAAGAVFTHGNLTPPEGVRVTSRWDAEDEAAAEGSVFSLSHERQRWMWEDALDAACVAVEALPGSPSSPPPLANGRAGGRESDNESSMGLANDGSLSPMSLDAAGVATLCGLSAACVAYVILHTAARPLRRE